MLCSQVIWIKGFALDVPEGGFMEISSAIYVFIYVLR